MLHLSLDNREIRSFRLCAKKEDLKSFFLKKDSMGVFVFSDTLTPTERILLREQLSSRDLHIIFYSKTLFKFLLKDKKFDKLLNLLQGDVFLIKDRLGKDLNDFDLNIILSQNHLLFRFLYLNQSIYRESKIKSFIKIHSSKKNIKQIPILLNNVVWENCILYGIYNKFSN